MKLSKRDTKKVGKSKKGGTIELSPLAAAGVLYAAAHYSKKGRKVRGGAGDVVATSPGGAVPVIYAGKPEMPVEVKAAVGGVAGPATDFIPDDVQRESPATAAITGSASRSPLVAGMLDLSKNAYIGATAGSRPAPVDMPGGLLQGGAQKKSKSKRKQKGGEDWSRPNNLMPMSTSPPTPLPPVPSMASQSCGHIGASIPPGTSSGGRLGLTPVVPGAVGGVEGQEEPSQFGGAKKGKKKFKKGGADNGGSLEDTLASYVGGAKKKSKSKKKRGGAEGDMGAEGGMEPTATEGGEYMDGGAKKKSKSKKKRGGAEGGMDAEGGMEPTATEGGEYMDGGAKKKSKSKKKRGGAEGGMDAEGGMEPTATEGGEYMGGAKNKRKSKKKRGGASCGGVEPFNAGAPSQADAMGGFDALLADLKKQVGGEYKKKGGAFKLYAKELSSLSKKLKKLV